mgnify:CR=1 FL=1
MRHLLTRRAPSSNTRRADRARPAASASELSSASASCRSAVDSDDASSVGWWEMEIGEPGAGRQMVGAENRNRPVQSTKPTQKNTFVLQTKEKKKKRRLAGSLGHQLGRFRRGGLLGRQLGRFRRGGSLGCQLGSFDVEGRSAVSSAFFCIFVQSSPSVGIFGQRTGRWYFLQSSPSTEILTNGLDRAFWGGSA